MSRLEKCGKLHEDFAIHQRAVAAIENPPSAPMISHGRTSRSPSVFQNAVNTWLSLLGWTRQNNVVPEDGDLSENSSSTNSARNPSFT